MIYLRTSWLKAYVAKNFITKAKSQRKLKILILIMILLNASKYSILLCIYVCIIHVTSFIFSSLMYCMYCLVSKSKIMFQNEVWVLAHVVTHKDNVTFACIGLKHVVRKSIKQPVVVWKTQVFVCSRLKGCNYWA